eukprot:XP_011614784.1 PREDICTED: midnolin isoform X1 [Takifugu rubripes]
MELQQGVCSFPPGRSAHCGAEVSTGLPTMRLAIASTTGTPVELTISRGETVEGLRTHISRRLRLQTDRIVLVHKHRQLTAGSLLDLGVTDGSKLTLIPVIEAGLACPTQRAERSFKDILESLTEVQVRDFLSGRSPIYINLEVGTHVMYVELQLSAQDVTDLQWKQDPRAVDANAGRSNTAPTSQTFTSAQGPSLSQFSPQRPRPQFNLKGCTSVSENTTHTVSCNDPFCPSHPSPGRAVTPVCPHSRCSHQSGSSPAASPVPATASKKTSSSPEMITQPGAAIDSFVSHSPGFYSGTFSGTLAPSCQSSISQHQHGIAIILQILNDLLKAPYHGQGPAPAPSGLQSPILNTEEEPSQAKKEAVTDKQRTDQHRNTSGECLLRSTTQRDQTLHYKLKQLQVMMHQRRKQRLSRRKAQISIPRPYRQPHHRP